MTDYTDEIKDLDTQRRGIRVLLDVAGDPGTRRVLLERLSALTFRLRLLRPMGMPTGMAKYEPKR